jgi:hypothetical protein
VEGDREGDYDDEDEFEFDLGREAWGGVAER